MVMLWCSFQDPKVLLFAAPRRVAWKGLGSEPVYQGRLRGIRIIRKLYSDAHLLDLSRRPSDDR